MKIFKRLAAAVSAAAMVVSMGAMLPAHAASVCSIDSTTEYQIIRGFGGMNHPEWQSYNGGGDMKDNEIQKAFGNGSGELGLTVLRIFVSDDKNAWKNVVHTAKGAQALGALVFATPWNPPASMRHAGGGGDQSGMYVLNDGAESAYATHLNDYVKYVESQGINLYSISVQNEPDYSREWTYWSPDRATSFIANYGQAVKAGTNAKLMSPESFQYSYEGSNHGKMYYKKILENAKANANCDLFGTHFYGTQRDSMNYATVKNSGKEIWMTEVYVPNSDANSCNRFPEAIQVAENIHNGLVVGNMSAYVWWYIRRSYSLLDESGNVTKRGAMMAQYSKWVRPGAYRIDCTEQTSGSDTLISAYKNEDGTIAVVAINKGSGAVSQNFSLDSGETIVDVEAYQTNANQNFAAVADPSVNGKSFTYNLPSKSVTTFLINTEGSGSAEPELDENGYWMNIDFENGLGGFSGRGAATAEVTTAEKYSGSQSLSVTGRTSEWHGAGVNLNKRIFKAGEKYSFSTNAMYNGSDATDTFYLSLQYTDASGETAYAHIAEAEVAKGQWVQLANTSYELPAGGSNFLLYVEMPNSTNSFFVDDVIVAPEGTKIKGAEYVAPVTEAPTEAKPTDPQPTQAPPVNAKYGDVNCDGSVNILDVITLNKHLMTGDEISPQGKINADVDFSGQPDAKDALNILKSIVKLIDIPIGEPPVPATEAPTEAQATHLSMADFTAQCQAKMEDHEPDSARAEQAGVQYGTVKSGSYFSTTCNREKPYNILLPAGYDPSKKYPVMYCMHGYYENQDRMIIKGNNPQMYTKQIIGNAIAAGEAKDMIVVFPYIFSSATLAECTGMNDENNKAYDNFINDLTKDLMPHIESTYSVLTGKDNTAITGFSMGGRESLAIGMTLTDKFGYIGAICPAPGVDDAYKGGWKFESGKEPYLIMITAGGNDQTVFDTPKPYHENLEKNGVPHIWHYYQNGYHGDNSIHAHLYNFCRFVFQN